MLKKTNIIPRKTFIRTFSFKEEMFVLYYAVTDRRTPIISKLVALFSLVYLISPIDLIPDFIPVIGYVDDLFAVPLLLHIAFTMLPMAVKEDGMIKAKKHMVFLRIMMLIILALLIGMVVATYFLISSLFHHLA